MNQSALRAVDGEAKSRLLDLAQVRIELGSPGRPMGKTTVFKLIREGRLPALKLGGKVVVSREAIDSFIESLPPARPQVDA
jgi:excisionase family DNA binding protein